MNVRTLQSFTIQRNGELVSYAYNRIYAVSDSLGEQLIKDGLVEEYKPTGTITENGKDGVVE